MYNSANVLLTSDLDAKITDFGTARVVPRDKQVMMTGGIGTLEFMAPEILAHEIYSKEADVYSFAIVLWQMIARKDPFENLTIFSIPEHVCKGERPQIPASCPQRIALLIKSCWNPKPSLRPDFGEVCRVLQVIAGLSPDTSEIAAEVNKKTERKTEKEKERKGDVYLVCFHFICSIFALLCIYSEHI